MNDKLSQFLTSLESLNAQTDNGPAKPCDVKQLMKFLLGDDEDINGFFDNMVKIGGAMFLLGTHYSVVKTIFSNPDWYAQKTYGTSKKIDEFKEDPTVKGLKRFLTATCSTSKEETASSSKKGENPAKRNLAALLDSSSEEEQISPPKKCKKSKEKEPDQVQTPPKQQSRSKKNKRKNRK